MWICSSMYRSTSTVGEFYFAINAFDRRLIDLKRFHSVGELSTSSLEQTAATIESMSTLFPSEIHRRDIELRSHSRCLPKHCQWDSSKTRVDCLDRRPTRHSEFDKSQLVTFDRQIVVEHHLRSRKQSRSSSQRLTRCVCVSTTIEFVFQTVKIIYPTSVFVSRTNVKNEA